MVDFNFRLQQKHVQDAAPDLLKALRRMVKMYRMLLKKVDARYTYYDAETVMEMNEAPLEAAKAIAKAEGR